MRWFFRLVLLSALGAIAFSLVRRRVEANVDGPVRAAGEDQWPPIAAPTRVAQSVPAAEQVHDDSPDRSSASVDATVALERPAPSWVVPVDGACPISHPVKVNGTSGIFHLPGGRFYERTVPTRCYAEADDAAADGYRAAKA
jgi:hypothetical protein